MSAPRSLPAHFQLGTATSSWQIEGDSQGRGSSMWDDFAAIPGRIKDGTTADPACDHVQRLDADLDLLSWLGVDAYRFSISWPRVTPQVDGTAISVIAREPGSIGTRIGDMVRVKPRRHYIFASDNERLRLS